MYQLKKVLKDWTPPAVWRLGQRLARHPVVAPLYRGAERGADYYDHSFHTRDSWHEHYTESQYYPLWIIIADRIRQRGASAVLDIGCGPGQVATLLRDKGITNYVGIDFSHERIQQARKVCPELEFIEADIFQTDLLHTRQYDTVICTEFLEHVERDLEVIANIQSGVRFFGSVPNFAHAGHVRHFLEADSVQERYSPYFADFRIDSIWQNRGGVINRFLMEGIKK